MADFSIGDAVGAGFSLITKRPLTVLAWSVVYLLLMVLPQMAHFAAIMPAWSGMMHAFVDRAATGGPPDMSAMTAFQASAMQSGALGWLANIAGLLGWAILACAAYRCVLEPENKGFASLRLGAQEGWLALVAFVSMIIMCIAAFAIALVTGVLIAIAVLVGRSMHDAAGGWVAGLLIFILVVAAICAFLWICVRLSLAGPLTFSERQFRLFESWSQTKGHAWKLFGLAVVLLLIMMAIGMVVGCIEWAFILSSVGMNGFDFTKIAELFAKPDWWRPYLPWIAVGVVLRSIVGAAFVAILAAPWAVAYRELTKGAKPQHPPVF